MKVGFVGWRGMVGSVLMERMTSERDFDLFKSRFFSTSSRGAAAPAVTGGEARLHDAHDLAALGDCDAILTCQGGDYTSAIHPKLRATGWNGYWIDAASSLRMNDDAIIVLDPVNLDVIRDGLRRGVRDYIGGNCTVSLMLLAIDGLLKAGLVEWVSAMTYQAASGAGAQHMRELLQQMGFVFDAVRDRLADPHSAILEIDRSVSQALRSDQLPHEQLGTALAGNVIAWIDRDLGQGVSREEWKAGAETNKILGRAPMGQPGSLIVEGICVRVGSMRCHSQALTIKLSRDLPLAELEALIAGANPWVELVPNRRDDTIGSLCPASVSGRLRIPIGRVRKLAMGGQYLSAFTVGDQLLWGAAEPLRRMLRIALERLD
ncbi:MAG TPA: aspartate-semialdehyde dehydrogenase [Burkholderiaceae bacterium]|nr:aspartate-semialdehyde dehydrogenase [Burkholderiaceae bacterium]